jgi:hypothetical protein
MSSCRSSKQIVRGVDDAHDEARFARWYAQSDGTTSATKMGDWMASATMAKCGFSGYAWARDIHLQRRRYLTAGWSPRCSLWMLVWHFGRQSGAIVVGPVTHTEGWGGRVFWRLVYSFFLISTAMREFFVPTNYLHRRHVLLSIRRRIECFMRLARVAISWHKSVNLLSEPFPIG